MIDHGPSANDEQFQSASGYDSFNERSPRKTIGLAVSILLHALMLWMILFYHPRELFKTKAGVDNPIMYVTGAADKSERAKSKPKAATAPPKKKDKTTPVPPPVITPPVVAAEPPPPPQPQAIQQPEMDMAAMIEARRRQRAEARPDPGESEESADDRARRIAKANATVSAGARGRNDAGGVFEVKQVGVMRGAFAFNGWSTQRGRIAQQLIEVDVTNGGSVKLAMIKRMIDLIREEKVDDFTWESHRLGRSVRLSARKEFEPELVRFLLLEFFNEDAPPARRAG